MSKKKHPKVLIPTIHVRQIEEGLYRREPDLPIMSFKDFSKFTAFTKKWCKMLHENPKKIS